MLSSKLQRNFYLKSLGTTKNVLFEQEDKNGFLFGFTENYIKIKVPFNKILSKTQQEVYITDYNDDLTMNVKLLESCIQQ
jgi:threonylcarbamoyladenosine tRNA methylthiotransferase MtaB